MLGSPTAHAATVFATWTFETSVPATAGPHAPELGSGAATGLHVSGATVYSNPAGNGSVESFSSNNWAAGDYYQFMVSTIGWQNILLEWDQASSSTGPQDFQLSYSTDGSLFTNFGATYTVLENGDPNAAWSSGGGRVAAYTFNFDLSSVLAINDTATAYFRLTQVGADAAGGGTVGTSGTNRVDNFSVSADSLSEVPEPSTYALLGAGLAAVILRRRAARV